MSLNFLTTHNVNLSNNDDILLQFCRDLLQSNSSLGIEILSILNTEWQQLGDYYFNENKYEQALHCYLQENSESMNK